MTSTTQAPPAPDPSVIPDPIAESAPKPIGTKKVALGEIGFDLDNHRDAALADQDRIKALAASMLNHGQQTEVWVNRNPEGSAKPYSMIAGHRRYAAAMLLGWAMIGAKVFEDLQPDQILALRAIENLQRRDLNVMETCVAVQQIYDHNGYSVEGVAESLSQDTAWVRDHLYLAQRICRPVRQLAMSGIFGIGHLRELAKIGDRDTQARIARHGCAVDDAGGGRMVRTVNWFKTEVERVRRPLGRVAWELDQPINKLPACVGCPHNSATDELLFNMPETKAGAGFCMDGVCYGKKAKACEKAVELTINRIVKKNVQPTKPNVDKARPAYLKASTAQRAAKRRLDQGGGKPSPKKSSTSKKSKCPTAIAIDKYDRAYNAWHRKSGKLISDAIESSPVLHLAALVVKPFDWSNWSRGYVRWDGEVGGLPDKPQPLRAGDKKALQAWREIKACRVPTAVLRTMKSHVAGYELRLEFPALVVALGEVCGVKIEDPPTWEDYKPKPKDKPRPKRKAAKKKPATRKRSTKKKATASKGAS